MRKRNKKVCALLLAFTMAAGMCMPVSAREAKSVPAATEFAGLEEAGSWYYGGGWEYQYSGADNSAVAMENGMVKATVDYSADADKDYSKMAISSWNDDGISFEEVTKVTLDFYYDEAKMTSGSFKLTVNSDALNVGDTALDLSAAEVVDGTLKKLPVTLKCDAANGSVNGITFCLIGVNTDYKGDIWLDNIQFVAEEPKPASDAKTWDFEDGTTQGWYFDNSWAGDSYHGPTENVCSVENGRLKVDMDYSKDVENGWLQPAISISPEGGIDFSGATMLGFEMYFSAEAKTTGNITVKGVAGNVLNEQMSGINNMETEDVGNGLTKAVFNFEIDTAAAKSETPDKLMLLLVGNNTDYKGPIYFDNIRLYTPVVEDVYVDATVKAETKTSVSGNSSALSVNGSSYAYADKIQLADPKADASAKALYQYLKAVGESDAALYGHMEDTVLKAGSSELSDSDTEDLTGSLAAINGLDCGGLFSGFASKYNARHPEEEPLPDTTEGNIKAAALLSNEAIQGGAVMTLSCHMPNFAFASEKDSSAVKTYDRFDYSSADSYNLKGDCMNQILPGGAFNPQFTAFLDLIAEYADQVDGAVLFRPFHENTGSWFWWGKAFCDAETYKSVFKYTVEYLRDVKGVHNLLYVYGPGSEAATLEEYGERYPGDEFVDMVGFDTYDDKASADESYTFMKNFESVVKLTDQFAKEHNKLFAVTETGITNSAMKKTGNERPEWFTEILDIITKPEYNCAYYMVWSNYDSKSNYYSPFAVSKAEDGTLHGHELMDGFIRFYNNEKSIFAADQKQVVYGEKPAAPTVNGWEATGYITAPLAGKRILEAVDVTAQLSEGVTDAYLAVSSGTKEIKLDTKVEGRIALAKLTSEVLEQLGEAANGKIILYGNGAKLAEITVIFNIAEKEPDPYMVDDFESYYGVDSMLTGTWATNKASGSTIELNLTNMEGETQDGYAMKFTYRETSGGWAGATINKEVDWSDCNALQFWTIPDGKQQKTVIQIQANNTCYEAYLNLYDDYNARAGKPTLVTIPFSEFCQRDTAGNPKGGLVNDCGAVSSFGLWVNAVDNEFFDGDTVSGTIWYDNITAVKTDVETPVFAEPNPQEHTHEYTYTDNGDGTHTKKCECGETVSEEHIWENGTCICGAKETSEEKPGTDDKKPGTDDKKPGTDDRNPNTGDKKTDVKKTGTVNTGDSANTAMLMVICAAALTVILGVVFRKRISRR
ncbi:glycosyl hydrolase [Roseburia hominis]